jgi:hypothetical protein
MNRTPVYDGIVRNRDIVANIRRGFFISGVDGGIILDVDVISYFNVVNISPLDRSVPYAALIPHFYLSDDDGVLCQEAVFAELRYMSFKFPDNSHSNILCELHSFFSESKIQNMRHKPLLFFICFCVF